MQSNTPSYKKLPLLTVKNRENESDEAEADNKSPKNAWIFDLFRKDFSSARTKLEAEIEGKSREDLLKDSTWLAYIDFKENEISGLNGLLNFADSNNESPETIFLVAHVYMGALQRSRTQNTR